MDQSGSRVVEALWRSAETSAANSKASSTTVTEMSSAREEMAKCLAPLADRLNASKFGRFVEHLIGSGVYRTNPQRWRQIKLGEASGKAAKSKAMEKESKGPMKRPPQPQKRKHLVKKSRH